MSITFLYLNLEKSGLKIFFSQNQSQGNQGNVPQIYFVKKLIILNNKYSGPSIMSVINL